MKARKGVHVRPIVSRCPWREREAHETTKPDILTEAEIQDIAVQISENGYRALPFVETGKTILQLPGLLCRLASRIGLRKSPYGSSLRCV